MHVTIYTYIHYWRPLLNLWWTNGMFSHYILHLFCPTEKTVSCSSHINGIVVGLQQETGN